MHEKMYYAESSLVVSKRFSESVPSTIRVQRSSCRELCTKGMFVSQGKEGKMSKTVVGFMFDELKQVVVLIEKKRPEWQKGLLNGIGGHIESVAGGSFLLYKYSRTENPKEAMTREFEEETGILYTDWDCYAVGFSDDSQQTVSFFRAFTNKVHAVKSKTDEIVWKVTIKTFAEQNCVANLHWLIPLAFDIENVQPTVFTFRNPYQGD